MRNICCIALSIISNLFYRVTNLNIILCRGVSINRSTQFEDNIKIYKNTSIRNSDISSGTYVGWNCILDNCTVGRFCSIGPYVEIIYGRHPMRTFVSTHPSFYSTNKQAGFTFANKNMFQENKYVLNTRKSLIIGSDVWIGYGAKIIEGITIGHGAVIGAGSIVTKDVEPYAIYAGNPAKFIRFRFEKEEIKQLLELSWWDKDIDWLGRNHEKFHDIKSYLE